MDGIDASLRRLGHGPCRSLPDPPVGPGRGIEETLEALNDVVRAGKARYIGASSMYAWQFMKALAVSERRGWARFVSMQNHYNLVYREEEREMIPLCIDQGIGIIPWSPLARGFLAGNRTRDVKSGTTRSRTDDFAHSLYYQDDDFTVVEKLRGVAGEIGRSLPRPPWPGCFQSHTSPRPSSGQAGWSIWSRPWRPCPSRFHPSRSRPSRSPTVRTGSSTWERPFSTGPRESP